MKLIYITNARIPTEKAHGLQIMKMCEAFASLTRLANNTNDTANTANSFNIELIVSRRINTIKDDPFEYYGVKKIFNIKKIFCLDLFGLKIVPAKISFYIQWFSFAILASIYAILKYKKTGNIFYSRDILTLFFLCLFGFEPVAEIHDYKAEKPKKWWIAYALKNVKKIITNSEGTKKFLQEHFQLPDDKYLIAPNGVDIAFFDINETKEQARAKLNLPQNKVIISYIGRLETLGVEKGVGLLLSVFAGLMKKGHEAILCVIGGPEHLIEKYRALSAKLGLENGRAIFTGHVDYRLVPVYLRAVDIVVVPFPATKQFSQTASPIKIFEFMAAGKIIIASDLPALKTALNESNAIFFEPQNASDLAAKINFVFDNQAHAAGLAKQASFDVNRYTWTDRAKKIMEFIKK